MIIKSDAVKNMEISYGSGCFCAALLKAFNKKHLKMKYLDELHLIKHISI